MTQNDIRDTLRDLNKQSSGLSEVKKSKLLDYSFDQVEERIDSQKEGLKGLVRRVLFVITCGKRPLSTTKLQHSLGVKHQTSPLDADDLVQIQDMVSVCAGLVTVDNESNVIWLAHYTTQHPTRLSAVIMSMLSSQRRPLTYSIACSAVR